MLVTGFTWLMTNLHMPCLAVPSKSGSVYHIWQLNRCVKWQCSCSKHQYFVCLVPHSIYQQIMLTLSFSRPRGHSKLWKFFQNLKVDSSSEYSTLRWAHKFERDPTTTHTKACRWDVLITAFGTSLKPTAI